MLITSQLFFVQTNHKLNYILPKFLSITCLEKLEVSMIYSLIMSPASVSNDKTNQYGLTPLNIVITNILIAQFVRKIGLINIFTFLPQTFQQVKINFRPPHPSPFIFKYFKPMRMALTLFSPIPMEYYPCGTFLTFI